MLKLSDIENASFREASRFSAARGYVCSDVDNFVDEVTETVRSMEEQIAELQEKLKVYEEKADSVQNAIITAEMAAKKLMKDASSKAERIISEAVTRSEKIIAESEKTAESNLYESGEKARLILDNALSSSAQCVEENNRIIDEQKIYITVLQNEAAKFKKALLDMYNSQLELIEKLPRDEDMKKYQKSMDEKYPTEQPVTADKVVEELKQEAENAVIPKKDEPDIKVEMSGDKENNSEASPQKPDAEIVFNSLTNENIKINYVNQNTNTNRKKNRNKNKRN